MGYDIDKFSPSSGKALDSLSNPINYIDILKLLNVKDGFHTTSTELNALVEGKSYATVKIFEIAGNGIVNVLFRTGSKIAISTYAGNADTAIKFEAFKYPTTSANGTDLGGFGRNLVTVIPKTANVYSNPTITTVGEKLTERVYTTLSGGQKGGVVGSESRVLIVPPNSSILYRITNLANTLSTATFEIDWIEVDV